MKVYIGDKLGEDYEGKEWLIKIDRFGSLVLVCISYQEIWNKERFDVGCKYARYKTKKRYY
jgi:hypothetical protein